MQPIAIIQHDPHDGPAYFGTWLAEQGLSQQVFAIHAGDAIPQDMQSFGGLGILGGPMSANDNLPYYPALHALVGQAFALGKPVIGHCLGGQIMARVLGGTVQASAHHEIGWSRLEPVHAQAQSWFGSESLQLFQWHGESFSIPPGATPLLRGLHCTNQAFVWKQHHLAMQFHCEVDSAKVRSWLTLGAQELQQHAGSPGVQDAASLLQDLDLHMAASQRLAGHIYQRWAQGLAR